MCTYCCNLTASFVTPSAGGDAAVRRGARARARFTKSLSYARRTPRAPSAQHRRRQGRGREGVARPFGPCASSRRIPARCVAYVKNASRVAGETVAGGAERSRRLDGGGAGTLQVWRQTEMEAGTTVLLAADPTRPLDRVANARTALAGAEWPPHASHVTSMMLSRAACRID
eukprot:354733-Chlamydomonas_euryale.AAC.6